LAIERAARPKLTLRRAENLGRMITLAVVLLGWVLFRSPSLDVAGAVLAQMIAPHPGVLWLPPLPLLALGCMLVEHVAWTTRLRIAMRLPLDRWYSPLATGVMLWCLVLYAPRGYTPFVYFQF
jgi:alginate O-acetyltransferase complex protein AlgI